MLRVLALPPALLRDWVLDQRFGDPTQEILRAAAEQPTTSIVMATHPRASNGGTNLSQVAEGVLTNADCPVVMVRPERGDAPWDVRRVLLPHDTSTTTSACI